MKLKKRIILLISAILCFAAVVSLTALSFVFAGNTTDFVIPKGVEDIISLQKKDGETYITTNGGELLCFSDHNEKWKTEITERSSDVIITEGMLLNQVK